SPKETLKSLWNVGAARCLTCSESLRVRRLRLDAPKFLFHADRIDQIAPAAAGRIGVRAAGSKIQRAKGRGSVPEANPQPEPTEPMTSTNYLHHRPTHLTPYIGVRGL